MCYSYLTTTRLASHTPARWFQLCCSLLELCYSQWTKLEEMAREKAIEEESLYRYRTKTHNIPEEKEEDERAMEELFPVYDSEFEEEPGVEISEDILDNDATEEVKEDAEGISSSVLHQFSEKELEEIASLHIFLFARTQYCPVSSNREDKGYLLAASLADIIGPMPGGVHVLLLLSAGFPLRTSE